MLLQRYQLPEVTINRQLMKRKPNGTNPHLVIDAKVRLRNLRKSLSLGTVVSYTADNDAELNSKGKTLNWGIRMDNTKQIIQVNANQILKVVT